MTEKSGIQKIESEIFTPALQKATQQAMDAGNSFNDTVMGAANAYINMLVELMGGDQARQMLENQADFLKKQIPVE